MKRAKELWARFDRYIMMGGLGIVIALEFLSHFYPAVFDGVNLKGALIGFTVVLVLLYEKVDTVTDKPTPTLSEPAGLDEGVREILKKAGTITSIDIYAHSGYMYYNAYRDFLRSHNKKESPTIRLLFQDFSDVNRVHYPRSHDAKIEAMERSKHTEADWIALSKETNSELTIERYPFEPTMHFMLVNKRYLYFGFFELRPERLGSEPLGQGFIVNSDTSDGKEFIQDCLDEFRSLWSLTAQTIAEVDPS